jgi:hypothetical protein
VWKPKGANFTMDKTFKHPLARRATTTIAHAPDGAERKLLVIVTTLELDAGAKGFNRGNVERLHAAARAYLAETAQPADYAIINRPKDWNA